MPRRLTYKYPNPSWIVKVISIFRIILILHCVTIAEWIPRHPRIPSETITDMVFINENTGYFCNTTGSIFKTVDGGYLWYETAYFPGMSFSEISNVDSMLLFALSPSGPYKSKIEGLVVSEDGGQTWNELPYNLEDTFTFFPFDEKNAVKSDELGISKSMNGFITWNRVYDIPMFFETDIFIPYGEIIKFVLLKDSTLLALGNNIYAHSSGIISDSISFILTSQDSGSSWSYLWQGDTTNATDMYFVNENQGFLVGEGKAIYSTKDGGKSWSLFFEDSLYGFSSVWAEDILTVYAMNYNKVYNTNDGGISWNTWAAPFSYNLYFNNFQMGKGFTYGLYGSIYIKDSGVNKWSPLNENSHFMIDDIEFVSPSTGFAGGWVWESYRKPVFFKTIDGGYTWEMQWKGDKSISGFHVFSEDKIVLIGGGNVWRTSDGGQTWSLFTIRSNSYSQGLYFMDEEFGIIYGVFDWNTRKSYNYITMDGGDTWVANELPIFGGLRKLKFTDYTHGWMLNPEGLWFSSDSGKTWSIRFTQESWYGYTFDFYNSLKGWVINDWDEIYYTIDGGDTWIRSSSQIDNQPNEMLFINENVGWISCYDGSLFSTVDGGITWKKIETHTLNPLFDITAHNNKEGVDVWIAGYRFTILHNYFDYSELGLSKLQNTLQKPVIQNHPNPFNPVTTIRYELPRLSRVRLSVYDILGREIAQLINTDQSPGIKEVQWNASNVPSGIYFVQIVAGNFRQVRKVMVLK